MAQGFCSNCGAPLAEGAAFCTACGTPAGGAPGAGQAGAAQGDTGQPAPPPPPAQAMHGHTPPPAPPGHPSSWGSPAPHGGFGAHAPAAGSGQKSWVRYLQVGVGIIALIIAAATIYRAIKGTSPADLDCSDIAEEAERISRDQPLKIQEITGLNEVSVSTAEGASERRCTGQARWDNGDSGTIYLRAFEEGGETKVSYSDQDFY